MFARLRLIGLGVWASARNCYKRITSDDRSLAGLELCRLKLNRGGRILFEVTVDYCEEARAYMDMIRIWVSVGAAGIIGGLDQCLRKRLGTDRISAHSKSG